MEYRKSIRANRAAFIMRTVAEAGRINRADLLDSYNCSPPNCALIFRTFLQDHPDAIYYDNRAKAYLPGPTFEHHLKTHQQQGQI